VIQLVWFKRDLRVHDHAALSAAAQAGPVLPLYVIETALWQQPDTALRHWQFIAESLQELDQALRQRGQGLLVEQGDMIAVLEKLHRRMGLAAVHVHEETGNAWTYDRDRRVSRWLKTQGIALHAYPQFGVVRPLTDRDQWAQGWDAFMASTRLTAPARLPAALETRLPDLQVMKLGYEQRPCPGRQRGGRAEALRLMQSFLDWRSRHYRSSLSSPARASRACARLSAHLAYGCVSLRELVQATDAALAAQPDTAWQRSLAAFKSRLYWHCHFIQKLEDQPDIELYNLNPAMNGLRETPDPERLQAWSEGRSGFPLIDACMRQLHHDGWLNFRMRACLVSLASYQLWLPWRETALHLARQFTDYEPGIHYCQIQMQSGTTGINSLRVYNPLKQSLDQDPQGDYIRHWVGALRNLPTAWIHQPWLMPESLQRQYGCRIGVDYPAPLVDSQQAARQARAMIKAHLESQSMQQRQDWQAQIRQRHASRKRMPVRRKVKNANADQLSLDF